MHRFIKGNTYYLPPKDRADDCFFEGVPKQFDSGMLSLGEKLSMNMISVIVGYMKLY